MKATLFFLLTVFTGTSLFSQNTGIGTSTPTANLEVKNPSKSTIKITSGGPMDTTELIFSNKNEFIGKNMSLTFLNEQGLYFSSSSLFPYGNSDSILFMTPSGFVGVNTRFPVERLDVNGNVRSNGMLINGTNTLEMGAGLIKQADNGKIGLNAFGEANTLSIIGGGVAADGRDRRIKFWADSATVFTGRGHFNGNVGIGTEPGSGTLTLNSPTGGLLFLRNSNALNTGISAGIFFGGSNYTTGIIQTIGNGTANARMGFSTGYSFTGGASFLQERLSIANNGNVGINTTAPAAKLEVNGNVDVKGKLKVGNDAGAAAAGAIRWNETTQDFEGYTGAAWVSLTSKSNGWGNLHNENQGITASDPSLNIDNFGFSVSTFGEYTIVGAPYRDVGTALNQGKAYIFKKNGTSWAEEAILTASDGVAEDYFGTAVAISGDLAIVGTGSKTIGANVSQGKAYIYKRIGTTWTQEADLIASDGAAGHYFGNSVSISGDYVIVGADVANSSKGKAYIFKRTGVSWAEEAGLTASDGAIADHFGRSVSISGEYVIVGAHRKDYGSSPNVGKAYIFKRTGSSWAQEADIRASDWAFADRFGISVAISGTYAIVGASGQNSNSGKAYIFKRTGTSWAEEAGLTIPDRATNDFFGCSVAITGEYVVIGADGELASTRGKAFIFKRNGILWAEMARLVATDGETEDFFGHAVAISETHAIIGAQSANFSHGKVYIFNK